MARRQIEVSSANGHYDVEIRKGFTAGSNQLEALNTAALNLIKRACGVEQCRGYGAAVTRAIVGEGIVMDLTCAMDTCPTSVAKYSIEAINNARQMTLARIDRYLEAARGELEIHTWGVSEDEIIAEAMVAPSLPTPICPVSIEWEGPVIYLGVMSPDYAQIMADSLAALLDK